MRVAINGEAWHLLFVTRKELTKQGRKHGHKARLNGLCDYDQRTIYVYERLTGDELRDTLNHEYLHAVFPQASEEWVTERGTEMAEYVKTAMGPTDG